MGLLVVLMWGNRQQIYIQCLSINQQQKFLLNINMINHLKIISTFLSFIIFYRLFEVLLFPISFLGNIMWLVLFFLTLIFFEVNKIHSALSASYLTLSVLSSNFVLIAMGYLSKSVPVSFLQKMGYYLIIFIVTFCLFEILKKLRFLLDYQNSFGSEGKI